MATTACLVGLAAIVRLADPFGEERLTEAVDSYADDALRLGFNDNWHIADLQGGGTPSGDPEQVILPTPFQQAEELGADTFRFIVSWNAAFPCGAAPAWSLYDSAYRYTTTKGSRPVVVASIGGGEEPCHGYAPGDPPAAANPENCTGAPSRDDDGLPSSYAPKADTAAYAAEWRAFIASVATRMPEALAIEIWNEPNSRQHWGFCNVSPVRYALLVRQAQQALRAAKLANPEISPDMRVAVAGLSPVGDDAAPDAEVFDWRAYLRTLVDAGVVDPASTPATADDVATVVATHPYLRPEDCAGEEDLEPAGAVDEQIDQARKLVGDVPVWITEVGASTSGNPGGDCRTAANAADQARQLVDVVRMMRSKEIPVGIFFRFAPSTVENGDPTDWFTEMGVLGQGYERLDDGSGADPYCALAEELDRSPSLVRCP